MRHVPGAWGITADTGDNKTCVSLFLITTHGAKMSRASGARSLD